jgi:hypothetical protein
MDINSLEAGIHRSNIPNAILKNNEHLLWELTYIQYDGKMDRFVMLIQVVSKLKSLSREKRVKLTL